MTKQITFKEVFKNSKNGKVLLPVIHCIDEKQVREQYKIAKESGGDGVFLINQGGLTPFEILDLNYELYKEDREFFCGINLLGYKSENLRTITRSSYTKGIWIDNYGINLNDYKESFYNIHPLLDIEKLIFGGIAFKYQEKVLPLDYEYLGHLARHYKIDIPTTSGDTTGEPPPLTKIMAIKLGIGKLPLAIASGIDSENVRKFLPYADVFIVSSSIEKTFGYFDSNEIEKLEKIVHE